MSEKAPGLESRRGSDEPTPATAAPRSLQRHAAALLAIRLAAAASQAVVLGALARLLDSSEFVLLASVLAMGAVVGAVLDLGISPATIRLRAQRPMDPTLRRLARLALLSAISAGMATLLLVRLLDPAVEITFAVYAACWAAGERACEAANAWLVADRKNALLGAGVLARRLVPLILIGGLLALGMTVTATEAALSIALASLSTAAILGAWLVRQLRLVSPGLPPARPALRSTSPFWVNSIGMQLRQLDVLVVGNVAPQGEAAAYAIVSRLVSPLRIIPTSFASALLPYVASKGHSAVAGGLKGLRGPLLLTVLLYAAIAALAQPFVSAIFGPEYLSAVTPLRILLVGLVFAALVSNFNAVLLATGHEWFAAGVAMGIGVATVLAVGLAAQVGGADAAAAALSVSYVAHAAILRVRMRSMTAPGDNDPAAGSEP